MSLLSQDIMYLPGVGPHRKELFSKQLGINTWGDLLEYYPYKYIDRSRIYAISEITGDMPFVQLRGKILSFEEFQMSPRKKRVVAHFSDGRNVIDLVWFQGAQYVYKNYKVNEDYIVFGRPTAYGGRYNIAHPDIEKAGDLQLSDMGMQPYYITSEAMKKHNFNSQAIGKVIKTLLTKLNTPLEETLQALVDIVRQGKALYVGISRWPLEALKVAKEYLSARDVPLLIYQGKLNLIDREPLEEGILDYCADNGIGFISFSPLAQGLLTDRYLNGIPADSRMTHSQFLTPDRLTPDLLAKLRQMSAEANQKGQTLSDAALQWILSQRGVTSVLVGVSKVEQMERNIASCLMG